MKPYKIAVVQFQPKFLQVEENLKSIARLCAELTTDLLVLPELATCGYAFASPQELQQVAEDGQTGSSAQFFAELSAKLNASIVYGFPELKEGKVYNSARLINPDGSSHIYQKLHLFSAEKLWFAPGETALQAVRAKNGVKLGLMICFDWIYPEVARTLALQGAQILCQVANLVLPWCQQAMLTRSLENGCISITANRVGQETNQQYSYCFTGGSQVVSHLGQRLGQLDQSHEGILQVMVDLDEPTPWLNKYNHLLHDRRPEFYGE